ncbi:hypothetical protein FB451DRAFT_1387324 [Mycena latifolia]|nr:hypothetical protein FB451DRAFT_1387324 [Mycena latifolia]
MRPVPAPDATVTPTQVSPMQATYNPTTPATQTSNKLGSFLTNFRTDMVSATTFTLQTLDGGVNTQTRSHAGVETNLDIQLCFDWAHYTIGVATSVPVTFISVGESNPDGVDGFMDVITTLINEDAATRPHVLSTSYSFNYNDLTRPVANITSVGSIGGSMIRVDMTAGITFLWGNNIKATDVATYLAAAVGATNSGKFSRTGRGFPDVATQGENFEIAWGTSSLPFHPRRPGTHHANPTHDTVDCTSCSTPTFAAIIALPNDLLVAAGKSPLGFLNPFLYSAAGRAALNDITSGSNPGCNTNGVSATAA